MNSKTVTVYLQDKILSVNQDHANVELENVSNAKKDISLTLMESVLLSLKTVNNTAQSMEPAPLVKINFHLAMDNVFLSKNQLDQST